tara:strand:+ start:5199 stop:5444 length:246 start_codon:yes stop_codon:yes gene_type:complete
MWPLLAAYGIVTIISGIFLLPITGTFGMAIGLFGALMVVISIVTSPPTPEQPDDQSKKYCSYCIAEINKDEKICPLCQTEQ